MSDQRVAIIGMAGRFPGASGPDELWEILAAGRETISRFTDADLAEAGIPVELRSHPDYIPARGIIAGALQRLAPHDTGELCNAPLSDNPAPQRDHGPNGLDQAERPGALQKPVNRAQRAGGREGKDEPVAAFLQRVAQQHR